jgi:hypothetical protein
MAQSKRPTSFYLFEGYAGVAEVNLDRWEVGDRSPATRLAARQACAALRRFARVFPIGRPRARLLQGRLLHLSGYPGRARAAWRASLAAAERLRMPLDTALAHGQLGRHAAPGPQGRRHLDLARALLDGMGITDDPTGGRHPSAADP